MSNVLFTKCFSGDNEQRMYFLNQKGILHYLKLVCNAILRFSLLWPLISNYTCPYPPPPQKQKKWGGG